MYHLMNKDFLIATFDIIRNEDNEEKCKLISILGKLPFGSDNKFDSWVRSRFCGLSRSTMKNSLYTTPKRSISEWINLTNCISVNDTFWVKERGEQKVWTSVSPYRNLMLENTNQKFLNNYVPRNPRLVSEILPEIALAGIADKCCATYGKDVKILKAGICNDELSCWCEVLSSYVYKELCPSYVAYETQVVGDKVVSASSLFTSEEVGFISYETLYDLSKLFDILANYEGVGAKDKYIAMIICDALCCNMDRHIGNHGFLFDSENLVLLDMAPVYDNNVSLFSEATEEELSEIWKYVKSEDNVPYSDIIFKAKILLTNDFRKRLRNMLGYKLPFNGNNVFTQQRVDLANAVINKHIRRILEE